MANRYPLILNASAGQLQELPVGDSLDLGGEGVLGLGGGSAGAPSISFTGDTNTGIYSPGADQVAISTGGSGRLFINSNGDVTVGHTSSSYSAAGRGLISVNGSSSSLLDLQTGTTSRFRMFCNGTTTELVNSEATGNLVFGTNSTERLRITSAGLVGIGTSSPLDALDVAGSISLSSGGSNVIRVLQSVNAAAYTGPGFYSQTSIGYGVASGGTHRWIGGDGNTELMRLTSTGLGIGSNATSPTQQLHVRTDQAAYTWARIDNQSSSASAYSGLALAAFGNTWGLAVGSSSANSNDLAFVLDATNTNSEKMRLDTSGRLLVGTSSARVNYYNSAGIGSNFQVVGSTHAQSSIILHNQAANEQGAYFHFGKSRGAAYEVVNNNDPLGIISFQGADGSTMREGASIAAFVDGTPGANDMPARLVFSTTADGASSPTERMRIKNNGYAYINTTADPSVDAAFLGVVGNNSVPAISAVGGAGPWAIKVGTTDTGTTRYIIGVCNNSNTTLGGITTNGTVITYGGTSDYRLKENIAPVSNALATLALLKPVTFTWKATGAVGNGFIAHELQEVFPDAVAGEKDATETDGSIKPQMVDQSKLVSVLTAALQEAIAKIESVEARLTAAGIA